MDYNRSRRGNSFQERDSEGRFTSSNSRRRRNDYNDNNNRQFDNNYDDYPRGRDRGYNDDEDDNYGGSYRESYGGRNDYEEDNYSNERGGWQSDRSGNEREGYGRQRNYQGHADGDYGYDDQRNRDDRRGNSNGRGFASMNRDEVRELGRRGGEASHGGRNYRDNDRDDDRRSERGRNEGSGNNNTRSSRRGTSSRGFASMPRSEVRRIAAMGGRASHGGNGGSTRGGRVSARRRSRSSR